jgi:hypothetical protein
MTIVLQREIPTRLLEACHREAVACFTQLGYGDRIYPFPLLTNDTVTARRINLVNVPPDYAIGVGGVSETEYTIESLFFFPRDAIAFKTGGFSYLDEVTLWRRWLFTGGTTPNKNGRIADPDYPGTQPNQFLATPIRFAWLAPKPARDNAAIEVPVHVTFTTSEDAFGNHV